MEVKNPHVFELLIDDGDDFDIFGLLSFAGFEAANATDIKLDFHACFGGSVEGFDHVDVFVGIHLGHDVGCLTFEGAGCFFFDEGDAEYLTSGGTVGVLKSINKGHPSIDITNPNDFKWDAWVEKDGSLPILK